MLSGFISPAIMMRIAGTELNMKSMEMPHNLLPYFPAHGMDSNDLSGQELPNKKRLKFFDKDPIEWTGNFELQIFIKHCLHLTAPINALRAGDTDVLTTNYLAPG